MWSSKSYLGQWINSHEYIAMLQNSRELLGRNCRVLLVKKPQFKAIASQIFRRSQQVWNKCAIVLLQEDSSQSSVVIKNSSVPTSMPNYLNPAAFLRPVVVLLPQAWTIVDKIVFFFFWSLGWVFAFFCYCFVVEQVSHN